MKLKSTVESYLRQLAHGVIVTRSEKVLRALQAAHLPVLPSTALLTAARNLWWTETKGFRRVYLDPDLVGEPLPHTVPNREQIRLLRWKYDPERTLESHYEICRRWKAPFEKSILDWEAWWLSREQEIIQYGNPPIVRTEDGLLAVPVSEPVILYPPKPRTVAMFWHGWDHVPYRKRVCPL